MLEIQKLFAHNPKAVLALKLMREVALEYKTIEQVKEELRRDEPQREVEIIVQRQGASMLRLPKKCCKQSNPRLLNRYHKNGVPTAT